MTRTKRCEVCGFEGTTGFTNVGHGFVLRGRTRTAQRLNMGNGPALWECKGEHRNPAYIAPRGVGQ